MRRFALLLPILALTACDDEPDTTIDFELSQPNYQTSLEYCKAGTGIKVVDTSQPVTVPFLKRMDEMGVEVIARYYGYTQSSPPPGGGHVKDWQSRKVISSDEVSLLKEAGFQSIAIFQYESDQEATFSNWSVRSRSDAQEALALAAELKQPKGSTIYFGADGDFVHNLKRSCKPVFDKDGKRHPGNCKSQVRSYFELVSATVRKAGYQMGVYGSGATCKMLTEAGLVDRCWLNFSPGHTGRAWGLSSRATALRQLVEAKGSSASKYCGGRNIDANWVMQPDFGHFSYK